MRHFHVNQRTLVFVSPDYALRFRINHHAASCLRLAAAPSLLRRWWVQQVLADNGILVAFDLMAEGIEAKSEPKVRKPRVLSDRVLIEPGKPEGIKAAKVSSKHHLLAEAFATGANIEELVELLGWNKDTVSSAFRTDIGALGLGVERKAGKDHLPVPKGVKRIAARGGDTTCADALAAAWK